jgi:hypothetical protein
MDAKESAMQNDPLSIAPPASKPPASMKLRWYWAEITDAESARSAANAARGAALFCAGMTLVATVLAMMGIEFLQQLGLNAWSLLDVALFLAVAWGIHRMSRTAAVLGLVLYGVERLMMMAENGPKGVILTVIFTLLFIGGVRGTFAYHRYKTMVDPAVSDTFA